MAGAGGAPVWLTASSTAWPELQRMLDGYKPGFSNGLLVSLEHLHVVHVGLPVLHVAAMVRRQHPHVVVRPGHGPNRTVVGL